MVGEKLIPLLTICTLAYFLIAIYKNGKPEAYLFAILYLFPFMNFPVTKESFGGLKVFDVISIFSFFYLIRYFLAKNISYKNYYYLLLFFLLLLIGIIGSLNSEFKASSLINLVKIFPVFIYSRFMFLECIQDPLFHYKIIKVLKLIYTTALIFLFIQLIVGLKFTFYSDLNTNTLDDVRNVTRYPGYFYDSQAEGQFFAMGALIILYSMTQSEGSRRVYDFILFLLCTFAMILSGSRSAYLGYFGGIILSLLCSVRQYPVYVLSALMIAAILYFVLPEKLSGTFSRFNDINGDLQFRQSLWKGAVQIANKNPLLGIGSGNYKNYNIQHNPDQYLEINNEILYFDQPENGYLKILVEFGYLGFIIFVLMVVSPLLKAIKWISVGERDIKVIVIAASLLSWLIAFDSVYSIFDSRILILVATIIVILITYPKTNNTSERS